MTAQAASTAEVSRLAELAADAALPLMGIGDDALVTALRLIADRLESARDTLVPVAIAETHLRSARLTGELSRTTFQLRLFARLVADGSVHGVIIDHADPDWPMGPRPDLRRCLVPLGPVAVFAASNFPFAFSVAGGDTAAALAARCPVIVKAHPGHPQLSELTGEVVAAALRDAGLPQGTFAVLHGEQAGVDLVRHPRIRAVAFTGSLQGGRALYDLACARDEPIPFYGEFGSLNPVVVTPAAAAARKAEIIAGFVASYTLGAGQFCTKPGLLLVPADTGFEEALAAAVRVVVASPLLNDRIASGYEHSANELASRDGVRTLVTGQLTADGPSPALLRIAARQLADQRHELMVECFGPTSVVVPYADQAELLTVIAALPGQLTATIHGEPADTGTEGLIAALSGRAGRIIWNGWPTGVSVTWAQHHGGPYPATTSPLHTSVGMTAISRFQRPVAYQDLPDSLLPAVLRTSNERTRPGRIDGVLYAGQP